MKNSCLVTRRLWALTAAILLAWGLTGCDEKEPEIPTQPYLNIIYGDEINNNLTIPVPETGGEYQIVVQSSRNWKMQDVSANWIHVNPTEGDKDKDTGVDIAVDANPDPAAGRSVTLIFTTTDGANQRKVVVNQGMGGGDIYFEDAGTAVSKDESGYWPYVTDFTGWTRQGSVDQSAVTYTGKASVRNSGANWEPASTEKLAPYVFLGANASSGQPFEINGISTGGATKFIFTWVMQDTQSGSVTPPVMTPISTTSVKLQVGFNGTDYADVAYTVGEVIGNGWTNVKAEFSVPSGTDKLYMVFGSYSTGEGLRMDDFTLTAGGDGALINPGGGPGPEPEGDPLTIAEVRALYTGTDYTFTEDKYTQGSVIVDFDQNNVASLKNMMISDGVSGITVRLTADVVPADYPVNTEVYVNLRGLTLTAYQGLVQLNNVPNANVVKTGQTKSITPSEITAAQFNSGAYQSMLVKISNVQFVSTALGKNMNDDSFKITPTSSTSATTVGMESNTADNFPVYMSYYAKFKATPVPDKSGYIIGVGSIAGATPVNQLMPRSTADFSGLTAARFGGDAKYLNVTPAGPVTVPSTGGVQTVNVAANVAWTAAVVNGNTATLTAGPTPAFGSDNQAVSLTFAENTEAAAKTLTLRISTMDTGVTTQTYDIVFNQVAAGAGETLVDKIAGLTAGTYYMAAQKEAGNTYELWTGALSGTTSVYCATNSYTYSGGVLTPVAADGANVMELVSAGAANTYYIKYGEQYLNNTSNSSNHKLAWSATPVAWVFGDASTAGVNPVCNGGYLSTSTSASSNYIRCFVNTTSPGTPPISAATGVFFFKAAAPAPAFGVSTTSPVAVTAAGGAQTVNVTGNVDWTAEVVAGNTATLSAQPAPASGTGAGTVTFTIAANTEQTAKSVTIRVSTTDAAIATKTYDIVFNQAAAAAAKTFGVSTASPVAVTAAGGAQTVNVTGNVDWMAEVVAGNTAPLSAQPAPASGTGAGTVSFTIAANTEQTAKAVTIRVSTTDAAIATKTYDIVFNQAAASVVSYSTYYTMNKMEFTTNSAYASYTGSYTDPVTTNAISWTLACGNNTILGGNASAVTGGKMVLGAANAKVGAPFDLTDTSIASALISDTSIPNVGRITVSGRPDDPITMGISYSTDGTTWVKQAEMIDPNGTGAVGGSGDTVFVFDTPVASAYYAVVIKSSSTTANSRVQEFKIKIETVD